MGTVLGTLLCTHYLYLVNSKPFVFFFVFKHINDWGRYHINGSFSCMSLHLIFQLHKRKRKNTATKYLENNVMQHNVTICPIFWAHPDRTHIFWRPAKHILPEKIFQESCRVNLAKKHQIIWWQGFSNIVKEWVKTTTPPPPPFGGLENFTGVNFFIGCWEPEEEWFWLFKPFSKLKMTFCKYWASSKIKISMTCQYKEYEVKIEIVQEQGLQLRKWSFYWVIT